MDIVEPHNTAETKCEPNTEQRGDDGKKLVEELVKIVSRLLLMIFFGEDVIYRNQLSDNKTDSPHEGHQSNPA